MAIEKDNRIQLPNNIRTKVNVPGKQGQIEQIQGNLQQQQNQQPIEITQTEDGGAEINFDPNALAPQGTAGHEENLAEFLEEEILQEIGSEIINNYDEHKSSRQEWEDSYTNNLDLLGIKHTEMTRPFKGSASVTHPLLSEAVTSFQAQAYKELLPSSGPVKTRVLGVEDPEKMNQAQRVQDFMNYMITEEMEEYTPEFDQLLFYLALAGSAFKKVYYDEVMQRAVSKFIPAEDLVVPYYATDLMECERITHVIKMGENEILKKQAAGFYRDIELKPTAAGPTQIEKKYQELEVALGQIEKDITSTETRLSKINDTMVAIREKELLINRYETSISEINKYVVGKQNEIDELSDDKFTTGVATGQLTELQEQLTEAESTKVKQKEHKTYLDTARYLMQDTGIKTKIIKQYLPIMNQFINKNLADMDFFVNFTLDEEFNETIKSRHRDVFNYNSFSEGEKLRIDLSILFTWREIAKMKNSMNTNLLILDEIFDSSLDASGTDEFMRILTNKLAKENVFVISHKGDTLIDKFPSILKFEKYKNFTRMA